MSDRIRLTVMAPFSCEPPRYGGPLRVAGLCRALREYVDVELFGQQPQRPDISMPPRAVHRQVAAGYETYDGGDLASLGLYYLTNARWGAPPTWNTPLLKLRAPRWLRASVARARVVHVEHPWQFAWARSSTSRPVTVGLQDEVALYSQLPRLPSPLRNRFRTWIARQERLAVLTASHVFAHAPADRERLLERYAISPERITVVPNGASPDWRPADPDERKRARDALGIRQPHAVIFAGSQHLPNVAAARLLLDAAPTLGEHGIELVIAGGVSEAFPGYESRNVTLIGALPSLDEGFAACDLAVNTVSQGAGSNMKTLEYLARGLATVSTEIGARGTDLVPSREIVVVPRAEDVVAAVITLAGDDVKMRELSARGLAAVGLATPGMRRRSPCCASSRR